MALEDWRKPLKKDYAAPGKEFTAFQKGQMTQSMREAQESISRYTERLRKAGVEPPKKKKKVGVLQRAGALLRVGDTAPLVAALQRGRSPLKTFKRQLRRAFTTGILGRKPEYKTSVEQRIDTSTYSDVLEEMGWRAGDTPGKVARGVVGLGMDVFLDPKNLISFGAAKAGRIAISGKGIVSLNDEGLDTLQAAVNKFGREEGLNWMRKKVAATGDDFIDKGGMKLAGHTVVPGSWMKKPIKIVDDIVEDLPVAGRVYKSVKAWGDKAFNPWHHIDELPEGMRESQKMLFTEYHWGLKEKTGEAVNKMRRYALHSDMDPQVLGDKITRYMEMGGKVTGDDYTDFLIKKFNKLNRKYYREVGERGIEMGKIDPYIRHALTDKGRKYLREAGEGYAQVTSAMNNFATALPGFTKSRKFIKVLDEAGEEVTDVSVKTLDPINTTKLIDKLESQASRKTKRLQDIRKSLASFELDKALGDIKSEIGRTLAKFPDKDEAAKKIVKEADDFTADEFKSVINSIVGPEERRLSTKLKSLKESLQKALKEVDDEEVAKKGLKKVVKKSRKKKIMDLTEQIRDIQREVTEKVAKVRKYDFVDDAGDYYQRTVFPAHEINEIMKPFMKEQGIDGDFFETNAFKLMAKRGVEHKKMTATFDLIDEITERYGVKAEDLTGPLKRQLTTTEAAPGMTKHFMKDGVRHVPMDMEVFGTKIDDIFVPEPTKKHLKKVHAVISGEDEPANQFLKLYDKITRMWKGSVTGWFPAFHSRNFIGGSFNNFLAGLDNPKWYTKAQDVLRYRNLKKGGKLDEIMGEKKAMETVKDGIAESVRHFDEEAGKALKKFDASALDNFDDLRLGIMEELSDEAKTEQVRMIIDSYVNSGKSLAADKVPTMEIMGKELSYDKILKMADENSIFQQPGRMDVMKTTEEQIRAIAGTASEKAKMKFKNMPMEAMGAVENRLRLPLFLHQLNKGDDAYSAAKTVMKYHFNYAPEALTHFERKVMKRMVPFYTWVRNNAPLQLEQLAKDPSRMAVPFKLRRGIEAVHDSEAIAEEREYMPNWMQEMFTIRMPFVKKTGMPYYLQLNLPLEDINKLNPREIVAMMNPILKYPVERIANKNIYFDSQIYNKNLPREYQTRETMDIIGGMEGTPLGDFLNVQKIKTKNYYTGEFEDSVVMDSRALYAMRNLFLSRFYAFTREATDSDSKWAEKLTDLVVGEPLRPLHVSKERWSQAKDEETMLRDLLYHMLQTKRVPYAGEEEGFKPEDTPNATIARELGQRLMK